MGVAGQSLGSRITGVLRRGDDWKGRSSRSERSANDGSSLHERYADRLCEEFQRHKMANSGQREELGVCTLFEKTGCAGSN